MSSDKTPGSRRSFLGKALWLVPATVALQGCDVSSTPAHVVKEGPAGPSGADYKYRFLTEPELAFVNAIADRMLPTDELGAGAVESGVAEFVDRQMETTYGHGGLWYLQGPFPDTIPEMAYQLKLNPREITRIGIAGVDGYCQTQYKKKFAELDHGQQEALMEQLEHGKVELPGIPSATFFAFMLGITRESYFADPSHGGNRNMAGWKLIGFPGARADYMDFVNQGGAKYPLPPVSINEANPKA